MGYNRPYDYDVWTWYPSKDDSLVFALEKYGNAGWDLAGIIQESKEGWAKLIFKKLRVTKDET